MPSRPIVVYLAAAFMVVSAVSALVSFLFPSPWTGGLDGALDDIVALIRSWGAGDRHPTTHDPDQRPRRARVDDARSGRPFADA
jgi:hypothetical protein